MRKPKEKLFACPKCNKMYKGQKCLQNHLTKKNHGFTFLVYYTSDFVKSMEYRLAQLEHKLNNLDFKNIVVESSDVIINSIKKKIPQSKNKTKSPDQAKYNISVSQLNIIFKMVNTNESEHNIKPSEVASKNEESYKILEPTIKN